MSSPDLSLSLIREEIRALSAYHVAPADGLIKLDAMENPHAFPEPLRAGLGEALAAASLNRYPPPGAEALKDALRQAFALEAGQPLLLGNGSDEIIQIVALALARPGAKLLTLEPAFVMFRMIATFCGMEAVGVPLNADFSLDADALCRAIQANRPAVTFIASPNNPTGNRFPNEALVAALDCAAGFGGLVVIDEAYYPFADGHFAAEFRHYPNALLMRTLSKFGLAGLRLGLLAGRDELIGQFEKIRLPYNINALTQAAARYALQHADAFARQAETIKAERSRLARMLSGLRGVQVFPSQANFVLVRVAGAADVFERLLARRILVKNLDRAHPLLHGCLRLTVGTAEENDALIAALNTSLLPVP